VTVTGFTVGAELLDSDRYQSEVLDLPEVPSRDSPSVPQSILVAGGVRFPLRWLAAKRPAWLALRIFRPL